MGKGRGMARLEREGMIQSHAAPPSAIHSLSNHERQFRTLFRCGLVGVWVNPRAGSLRGYSSSLLVKIRRTESMAIEMKSLPLDRSLGLPSCRIHWPNSARYLERAQRPKGCSAPKVAMQNPGSSPRARMSTRAKAPKAPAGDGPHLVRRHPQA